MTVQVNYGEICKAPYYSARLGLKNLEFLRKCLHQVRDRDHYYCVRFTEGVDEYCQPLKQLQIEIPSNASSKVLRILPVPLPLQVNEELERVINVGNRHFMPNEELHPIVSDNKSAMDSKNSYISTVRDALSEDSNDDASTSLNMTQLVVPTSSSSPMQESPVPNAAKKVKPSYNVFSFSNIHGRNITLSNSNTVATRTVSFCKSLVFANQRLKRGYSFKFCIEKMSKRLNSTIAVGAISSLSNLTLPVTAFGLKHHCWIITNDCKNINGKIVLTREAEFLKNIKEKSIVSLYFHYNGTLFLVLDNKYWCRIVRLARTCRGIYPTVDVYGRVSEISIVPPKEILPGSFKLETIVECSEEDKEDFEENID